MGSITNDRDRTENKKYIGIRILAVLFWIAVWQIASMWLGQEILLASQVISGIRQDSASEGSCWDFPWL